MLALCRSRDHLSHHRIDGRGRPRLASGPSSRGDFDRLGKGDHKDRQERLAALGVKSEISTPPGEPKMSAVILQLAEPLLKQHGKTPERAKAIISLAVAGWNKAMFPVEQQPAIETDLINCFVPKDGSAESVGVAVELMDFVADRRKKLFPDLRKIIVDYEVIIAEGCLTLNVSSAPLPERP